MSSQFPKQLAKREFANVLWLSPQVPLASCDRPRRSVAPASRSAVMGKDRVDERRATAEAVPSWQPAPSRRASSSVPLA